MSLSDSPKRHPQQGIVVEQRMGGGRSSTDHGSKRLAAKLRFFVDTPLLYSWPWHASRWTLYAETGRRFPPFAHMTFALDELSGGGSIEKSGDHGREHIVAISAP